MKRLLRYFPIPLREVARVARLMPFDTSTAEGRSLERYRRIVLSIVTSVAARAVTTIVGLAVVPIAIAYLGKEQYGLWAAINAFVPWIALFDLGLVAGLVNPIAEAHGRDDRASARAYFSTAFVVLLGIAASILAVAGVLWPLLSSATVLPVPAGVSSATARASLAVALALVAAALPLNALPQVYAGYQRSYVPTAYATLAALVSLALFLTAVQMGGSLPWVLGAANSAPVVGGALTLAYLWLRDMRWIRPTAADVSRAALRRLLATSIPLYVFQIGALLVNQSQQLVLARRAGLGTVAEYDILLRIFVLTTALTTVTSSSFAPTFREAYERGELGWMRRSFWHLVRLRMLVAGAVCLALVLFGNVALRAWIRRSDFQYDLWVWLTLSALILVAAWASSFGELLTVLDRIWPQVIVVLAQGLLTATLTWFLGASWGVQGALVALTIPAALLSGLFFPRMARPLLTSAHE
jgi:O-antigen/teichoic acid export membrane protein